MIENKNIDPSCIIPVQTKFILPILSKPDDLKSYQDWLLEIYNTKVIRYTLGKLIEYGPQKGGINNEIPKILKNKEEYKLLEVKNE